MVASSFFIAVLLSLCYDIFQFQVSISLPIWTSGSMTVPTSLVAPLRSIWSPVVALSNFVVNSSVWPSLLSLLFSPFSVDPGLGCNGLCFSPTIIHGRCWWCYQRRWNTSIFVIYLIFSSSSFLEVWLSACIPFSFLVIFSFLYFFLCSLIVRSSCVLSIFRVLDCPVQFYVGSYVAASTFQCWPDHLYCIQFVHVHQDIFQVNSLRCCVILDPFSPLLYLLFGIFHCGVIFVLFWALE